MNPWDALYLAVLYTTKDMVFLILLLLPAYLYVKYKKQIHKIMEEVNDD